MSKKNYLLQNDIVNKSLNSNIFDLVILMLVTKPTHFKDTYSRKLWSLYFIQKPNTNILILNLIIIKSWNKQLFLFVKSYYKLLKTNKLKIQGKGKRKPYFKSKL